MPGKPRCLCGTCPTCRRREQLRAQRAADPEGMAERQRERTRKWKEAHPDAHAASKRRYNERNQERIRAWRSANPDKVAANQRRWVERNRDKHLARAAANNALRSGALVRPDACDTCGAPCKPEAHHEDYSKPLDVRWLCATCHGLTRRVA